ncbi:MAG: hypothetical protein AB7H90_08415 [Alphaproteobacteria bacterium]
MWAATATIVLSVISGIGGWLLARFLGEPYKAIEDLRRETQYALVMFGNIGKSASDEDRQKAAGEFRRIGVALVSYYAAAPWRMRQLRRHIFKWNIDQAGRLLIKLSNDISVTSENFGGSLLRGRVYEIRNQLGLPSPDDISPGEARALSDDGDDGIPDFLREKR